MENYNICAKMSVEGHEININIYTKINNYVKQETDDLQNISFLEEHAWLIFFWVINVHIYYNIYSVTNTTLQCVLVSVDSGQIMA